jgi:predicted adenine nucleotide alpha hydrolase (AANH) superfamily ATPase
VLVVTGLISATTRKHISAFVQEYCGCDYAIAKKCFKEGLGYDIIEKKFVYIPD